MSGTHLAAELGLGVYRGVLPKEQFSELVATVVAVDELEFEPPEDPLAFTSGSFWCPALDDQFEPRNAIEEMILGLTKCERFRSVVGLEAMAGAEWYTPSL